MDKRTVSIIVSILCLIVMIALLAYIVMNVQTLTGNPCDICETKNVGITCVDLRPYINIKNMT